jgi:hypothetical protein
MRRLSPAEPREPLADEGQPLAVDAVDACAPTLLLAQEARPLQDAQMPRGRGPFVREAARDLARRRLAAAEVHGEQDLAACGVRESGHYGVEQRQPLPRIFGETQTGSTSQIVSCSRTGPIGSHTAMTSGV